MCAGRPFFIRIGVSQASRGAGVEQRGEHVRPQPRVEVVDVGLDSSGPVPGGGRRRAGPTPVGSPTSSRSTFAWVSGSRPPAPTPTSATAIAGCGAERRGVGGEQRRAGRRAQLHRGRPARRTTGRPGAARRRPAAAPASRRARRGPCRSRPRRARRRARSRPRCSSPAQTPTTSAIASRAPTSWKCTSVGRGAVDRGLGDREPLEGRPRPVVHGVRQSGRRRAAPRRRARCGGCCCRRPRRGTGWPRSRCGTRSPGSARRARGRPRRPRRPSTSSGTPAPTRAPSSMSPLAPEEASTQPITRAARGRGVAGDPGGEHAGAEAVVDVDDRDPGRAGVEHRRAGRPARRTRRRSRRWWAPRRAARR